MKIVKARAHTNIALIKYWGKKNTDIIIPMNNSFSLTLDHFYTDTKVTYDEDLKKDSFSLNGEEIESQNVFNFLDYVRQLSGKNGFVKVESINHVPTTAGLASSASAYAALAAASSRAFGLDLSRKDLSRLARRGSGSATRSIYGGFTEWIGGDNDLNSYAKPFQENVEWDIRMIAAVINSKPKKITSRSGMQTVVNTSPFYGEWVKNANNSIPLIKKAILDKDFTTFGEISEENAMKMHALNLTAHPHFSYFEPQSIEIMQAVEQLRQDGIEAYYTMDAGPNVKIICEGKNSEVIQKALKIKFPEIELLESKPGKGIQFLD